MVWKDSSSFEDINPGTLILLSSLTIMVIHPGV